MDKLADTVKAIMEQGGPLAVQAMYYWLWVHVAEDVMYCVVGVLGFGSAIVVTRMIIRAIDRYNRRMDA